MALVDYAAWMIVRVMGLYQFLVGYTINCFYHPSPTSQDKSERDAFDFLLNAQFGGNMLFQSRSPEDFPKIISGRLLLVGRCILVITMILVVSDAAKIF